LTVPLSVVERIVGDELEAEPAEIASPGFTLSFQDSAGVPGTPFGELIYETARRHELNPELIAAMVKAESAFDPEAVSVKGARGLLQLMPATAMRFGVLKWLVERYPGDLPRILSAYNAGEGSVDRYGGVPPFRETRDYIRRIYSELGMDSARSGAR
jgi:soluble lytic murein transglycosylase-like protein